MFEVAGPLTRVPDRGMADIFDMYALFCHHIIFFHTLQQHHSYSLCCCCHIHVSSYACMDRYGPPETLDEVKIVTLAPELKGAAECVHGLRSRGIVVSAGHTRSSFQQAQDAVDAGLLSLNSRERHRLPCQYVLYAYACI
jgi:hypothetical protein